MIKEKNWMKQLSLHYQKCRDLYPADRLMVLFDIDGTILDMRYMMLYVLRSYDQRRQTDFFKHLTIEDVTVHENQMADLLKTVVFPPTLRDEVMAWYVERRWSSDAIRKSHRPFEGVLEVIRWFQMQPNTDVGLNTGRPETIRSDTLRSLNSLGNHYKVSFVNELLYMNSYGWDKGVRHSKQEGIRYFQNRGYRVFGYIDNEPENLKAVSECNPDGDVLLLHANTIFESKRKRLPSDSISGTTYDLTELIHEKTLPRHVRFVWHGVNDEVNLRQFVTSNVQWGEFDVRLDPMTTHVILRHDSFETTPLQEEEQFFLFEDAVDSFLQFGKSIKLDLKEGGFLIENVLALLRRRHVKSSDLWFTGQVDVLKQEEFRDLVSAFPEAVIQCPIDFLTPMIIGVPEEAGETLALFHE